jgi:hypothetical protein
VFSCTEFGIGVDFDTILENKSTPCKLPCFWGFAAQNGLHLAFLLAFQMHLQQRCVAGQAGSFANIARDSLGVGISKFLPVHNPRPPHD